MRTIFLSAGIPEQKEGRNLLYFETADIIAIRDSVLSLIYVCLKLDIKIVWGGHPAITPIVYEAIRNFEEKERMSCTRLTDSEIKKYIQDHVHLFQSSWFEAVLPKDNNKFDNVTMTERKENVPESLYFMRSEMLKSYDLEAAIYIGGMEGVIDEDSLFNQYYPSRPTYPIASTGGAALEIYERYKSERNYNPGLLSNYAYTSLFFSILNPK